MEVPPISPTERLILANQYKLLALLDTQNQSTHQVKSDILMAGHEGFYSDIFDSLSEGTTQQQVDETHDILEMFMSLEEAVPNLTEQEREQINPNKLTFQGFDGNHEPHYQIARFMIERLDYYEYFKGRKMNSHTQGHLPIYRSMVAVFKRLGGIGHPLSFDDIKKIEAA